MKLGLLRVELFINESNSLKDKRMVLESLKKRLRNNFNIAVIQIDQQDKWQRAKLAIATIADSQSGADSILSRVLNFIDESNKTDIIDYEMEMI